MHLALNANWRSEAAQNALVDFALNPGKAVEPSDRVAAVDAIIKAARLQLRGARQDAALFKTLVALLDDKDEELRTMASNTLAPIRDSRISRRPRPAGAQDARRRMAALVG